MKCKIYAGHTLVKFFRLLPQFCKNGNPKDTMYCHAQDLKEIASLISNLKMQEPGHRYFIINKPYNMVSQFVSPDKVSLLKDVPYNFPEGIHAVGRLDNYSEGLLILTTNKKVTRLLFQSAVPHKRTYLVLVNKNVTQNELQQLQTGVAIRVKGGGYYTTAPCAVMIVDAPGFINAVKDLTRKHLPETWLQITLTEGKFHQIRKMVKAIGHRCKRLIRISIEDLQLNGLPSGHVKELQEQYFFEQLKIDASS